MAKLCIVFRCVHRGKEATAEQVAYENDEVTLGLLCTSLVADFVDDATPHERDESEVAWFGIVQVSSKTEEIDGVPLGVQEARSTKIVDAETEVMDQFLLAGLEDEADLR